MSFIDLAKARKSIRKFKDKEIPKEMITTLLKAAKAAPSAGNCQPWTFYVITRKALISAIAEESLGQNFAGTAPLMIVVCADAPRSSARYLERGSSLYCIQDTAAAVQNILLCAHDIGLGACWCGAFDEADVAKKLDLPQNLRPVALLPIGYPAQIPVLRLRRPISEISVFIE